jgi:hypothetical protein
MPNDSSRRNFLAAGLVLPASAIAATAGTQSAQPAAPPASAPKAGAGQPALQFRTLGKTGLKVTSPWASVAW